jgi:tetratricopeptide (TPR) repeat protein
MLCDVRYRSLARRLAQEGEMKLVRSAAIFFLAAMATRGAAPAHAGGLQIPDEAKQALNTLYSGDADAAIAMARKFQSLEPDHPLGYLLEGEARWWQRYCAAVEIKYGMVEAWKRSKEPEDEYYFRLTDKAIQAADSQLAKQETADLHFFKGMGWALKVRVYGLRNDNRLAARAAVNGRAEMLRALELDPDLADATAALGIYNYYVSTLSPIVKLLRFFMGIPGGDKELGVKQMETAMTRGVVLDVDVRFILARALRQYDEKYERALQIAEPLAVRYPKNPNFLLLLGNLNVELGRKAKASNYFHAVLDLSTADPSCPGCSGCPGCAAGHSCLTHAREIANSFLASLH